MIKYFFLILGLMSLSACTSEDSAMTSNRSNEIQGPPGPQGPAGPTGPQGIQGIQGIQGPAGSFHAIQEPIAIANGTIVAGTPTNLPTGWLNPSANYIYVQGSIEFWGVNTTSSSPGGCKSASLEIQWTSSSAWKVLQSLYFEGIPRAGSIGEGTRFPINFILPPGGRFRIVDNANPNCQSGTLYLGSHPASGLHHDAGWFYSPMN